MGALASLGKKYTGSASRREDKSETQQIWSEGVTSNNDDGAWTSRLAKLNEILIENK